MYPQLFEIRIDDDTTKKYYAGQIIEGRVLIVLQKEKAVRGILIRLIGKGHVFFDAGRQTAFSESEAYVNEICQLFSPEDGRHTTLPPGSYEYFFSLQLPANIPSSLEAQNGFVRYYLQAAIQRPWKDDQIQEYAIVVTSISDLNSFPETATPLSMQKEKHVGFNICQAGPIILNFMIGKTGFVPGEYGQFGVDIRNNSTTKINRVHVSFKRQLSYHAKGEVKITQEKILQLNGPSAEAGGYMLWQNHFEIPLLPPSEFHGCTIISLKYYVEVKLVLDKWADVKYAMPVIIGTIPHCDKAQLSSIEFMKSKSPIETPKTPKQRNASLVLSRKNSVVKSPITGEEFTYDETEWVKKKEDAAIDPPTYQFSPLPPLDLAFFQHKPEKNPYFKSHDDCGYEFCYPYRVMSTVNFNEETTQPVRPHSNPGHLWEKSVYWNDDHDE